MEPLVVAGLGNPGTRYAATRHNVGFAVAHRLVDRLSARPLERTDAYAAWRVPEREPPGRELAIVTPLWFMNRSGEALRAFGQRHGLEASGCLVIVDDVYLPLGRIRLRARGTDGGHNGLASVAGALGTQEFSRLRIGVGRGEAERGLADHVLAAFDDEERPLLEDALERSVETVLLWATEGITAAMNRANVSARDVRDNAPEGER
jgi:peptidyl-tRNA hydrolase, PTH1 family